ncbi:MAG TPA: carboxypeptidase-like regulatory domain-containing protein [Acidobacteriaceae bacterium]
MKPKHLRLTLLCTLPIFAFGAAIAQTATPPPMPRIQVAPQPTTPQIGGTVTGHVYCGDTQRPARFADVELLQQSTNTSRGPNYQSAGRGRTALDGSFTITGVPAGDYYVAATMSGYISQQAVARMTQQPIARVPMTHIDAGRSADVVVTMDRGAVVSGRVTYDDGSAVPGVSVRLRPLTTATTGANTGGGNQYGGFGGLFALGGDMGMGETDDRGVYRLTGIAPGKYSLVVTVQTETTGQGRASGRGGFRGPPPMLNVYAPGTMRKADAQIVEIHGGETADGVDIRVALNGLHTVQGSVESKADGHMLNAGSVSLADATDSSTTRSTVIDPDGTFRMEYLPPGTYNVTVTGMDRSPDAGRGNRAPTIRYTAASQTVTLGDSDITMDPVQATVAASSTSTSQ